MICSCSIIAAIPFFELSLGDLACSAVWTVEEQEPLHPPMPTISTSVALWYRRFRSLIYQLYLIFFLFYMHRVPSIYSRPRLDL